MAQVEPMDVDNIEGDFDDKENSLYNSNVFPKTSCTEKGYEDLDMSEFNMKLRYSITPASSPMSRSYTANYSPKGDTYPNSFNSAAINDNANLTRSLNSSMTKSDNVLKSPKLPLQALSTDLFTNSEQNFTIRPNTPGDVTVTITACDNDDILSLPSTSSIAQTPEATTPTKDIPKNDSGSPIMRGLKSVFNMFRSSQSPIPPPEEITIQEDLKHTETQLKDDGQSIYPVFSTTTTSNKTKESTSKRNSPLKESVVFNDDLERELQWKGETGIKEEKNSKRKLSPLTLFDAGETLLLQRNDKDNLNTTVENINTSYISGMQGNTMTDIGNKIVTFNEIGSIESDSEFVDCETTYTKAESYIVESVDAHSNILPIIETFNIAHEVCSEEYIKPIIYLDNISSGRSDVLNSENINDKQAEDENIATSPLLVKLNANNSGPNNSEMFVTGISSIPLVDFDNKSFSLALNTCKKDQHEDIINNIFNVLKSDTGNSPLPELDKTNNLSPGSSIENNITPKETRTDIQENEESSIPTYHSYMQENLENNQGLQNMIPTNNFAHESCVEEYCKRANESPSPLNETNINVTILDNNEDQVLNIHPNHTKVLTPVNVPNYEDIDITIEQKQNIEFTPEQDILGLKNLDTDKKHLINQTVVLEGSEYINENISNPINADCKTQVNTVSSDVLKDCKVDVLSSVNCNIDRSFENRTSKLESDRQEEQHCHVNVLKDNFDSSMTKIGDSVNEYNMSDTAHIIHNIDNVIMDDLQHCYVDKDTLNNNLYIISDSSQKLLVGKDIDFEFECNLNTVHTDKESNLHHDSKLQLENYEYLGDQTTCVKNTNINAIDTPLQLYKDEASCQINETDMCKEVEVNNFETNSCNVILPEQHVSEERSNNLPNDFEIKKDGSKDPYSAKENNTDVCGVKEISSGFVINNKYNLETAIQSHVLLSPFQEPSGHICKTKIDDRLVKLSDVAHPLTDISDKNNYQGPTSAALNEDQCGINKLKSNIEDEEVLTSANNSPYISVNELDLNLSSSVVECKENALDSNSNASPPISLKSTQKSYNLNFDEIIDPFATKTNIRLSPPPPNTLSKKSFRDTNDNQVTQKIMQNGKNLQEESIKSNIVKKPLIANDKRTPKLDKKIDDVAEIYENKQSLVNNVVKQANPLLLSLANVSPNRQDETKSGNEEIILPESHTNSDNTEYRNIFNLPEINDVNFNPFVTKSRIRLSPSPPLEFKKPSIDNNIEMTTDVTYVTKPRTEIANDTLPVHLKDEVNNFSHMSDITTSSKNTDDRTVHEIHTEDEDTVEGPFLEDCDLERDLTQCKDLPLTSNNEDLDKDEIFIDAEAFEFLLNQNKSNVVLDSGKESLFLKFDPLFANRTSSDGALAVLNSIQRKQSTPKKLTKPSSTSVPQEVLQPVLSEEPLIFASAPGGNNDEIGNIASKPMMAVSPAVNSIVTPRILSTPKTSRRSFSCTSPAIVAIDRLLSLSGNTSLLDQNVTIPHPSRSRDTNIALTQLREILAEKELHVHSLKCDGKELKERLSILESQVKGLEAESADRLKKINSLNEQLDEKTRNGKCMAVVVEEYERTIATLIAEMEQDRKQRAEEKLKLTSERDEQTAHLASMEGSFNDLHSKYEKSKQIILSMKTNEDKYKKVFKEFDESVLNLQKNYELLAQHATSKLNNANLTLDKMNKAHESEVVKLTAMLKRRELDITSLEDSLAQKIKANEKLTAICDELLNKVA